MAPRAEEGRSKAAKSLGEPSSGLSRGYPNEATRPDELGTLLAEFIGQAEVTRGTETS